MLSSLASISVMSAKSSFSQSNTGVSGLDVGVVMVKIGVLVPLVGILTVAALELEELVATLDSLELLESLSVSESESDERARSSLRVFRECFLGGGVGSLKVT